MKVAVYTISKSEAKQVQPYMAACRDADLVVVADTGSDDGTPDLLRREGAVVHDIAVRPWRFDVARTASLCLVPADVDVCIKLDLDERLQPGWRAELERAWAPGTTRLRYWYTWNWKAPGVPDVVFRSDLIHARAGYLWRYPTHEVLDCSIPQVAVESELAIHQYPEAKPRPNDLPLLELAVREHRCPRTLFYLGREHSFRQGWADCQRVLEEYLALPESCWASERSHAMRLIAGCRKGQGDAAGAVAWLLRCCAEDASLRENWIELAQAYYEMRDWSGGYHACERALAVRERPRHYQSFGYAWGERADDLASVCAWYMGLKDKAAEHMRRALAANPGDVRLQGNANYMLPERLAGDAGPAPTGAPAEPKCFTRTSPHAAHPVYCRERTSDLHSFHQVFVEREYACLDDVAEPGLILDCGAYAGYSAVYFLSRFPNCRVIAVEPYPANYEMLRRNVASFGDRVRTVRAALWSRPAALRLCGEGRGSGQEWASRVRECADGEAADVAATDVGALLRESGRSSVSVLKVDVEGAEKVIFADCESWIDRVENIVIELHDPESVEILRRAVAGRPFQVGRCGELTVCKRVRV